MAKSKQAFEPKEKNMYKMLIVDDEYLARTGICETIDWQQYDISVVATAVNGKDGLEKIAEHKPDIIISDIKMPIMDGIQLVSTLYEQNYDGIIIMLSGYNDFEYAKTTLEKGVFRYLLKPIDNDELVDTVVQAKDKLIKRRKMDMYISDFDRGIPIIKNSIADSIFHGCEIDEEFKQKMSLYDMPFIEHGIVVYCNVDLSTAGNEQEREQNARNALELVQKGILSILSNHKVFYASTEKRIAFCCDFVDVDALEKSIVRFLREYEKQCSVVVSIGISAVFNSMAEISAAFGAAKFIASNRLYSVNSVYVAQEVLEQSKMYKRHIVDALQYVAEHYNDCNLKIKTVAEALYVSESYLMHLFKQEVGKTFNTCLTEYRVMMAKQLLVEQKYKVYEIAELVGYQDMKYFGQVFRKAVGCTPSEYVKKYNEKKS